MGGRFNPEKEIRKPGTQINLVATFNHLERQRQNVQCFEEYEWKEQD